jgi:pimeloyl-ACP methyl ester carboxylesterase
MADALVLSAIPRRAPRIVSNGVPLTLEGVAKNTSCPIYVLGGELDNLTPPHNAPRIAAEAGGPCELLIVKSGNHAANKRRYRVSDADCRLDGGAFGRAQTPGMRDEG